MRQPMHRGSRPRQAPQEAREEVVDVEWEPCQFRDTELYGGEYFPRRQVHALSLSSGQTFPIEAVSPVVQTMYVTVISGVLSLWFGTAGTPTPSGDQPHMEFVSGAGASGIVLAPGQHQMVVGAANSAACVATIVILDREAHSK